MGALTAIPKSTYLKLIILSPSINEFTSGNSFAALVTALAKKDINPKLTSNFSLKSSLYFDLKVIILLISTSLKVVNIAVSFLTFTNLLDIFFLSEDNFLLSNPRSPL